MSSAQRHKIFVSYHHANDQGYRDQFEKLHHGIMVSRSVQMGDIDRTLKTETVRQKIRDEYLRDSTVTVVLIGSQTWQRKHVDWEIGSSIRDTQYNPRSGLLGIILPSHPSYPSYPSYDPHTIPPRLYDNIKCKYAEIYRWPNDLATVQEWIHKAFSRRTTMKPDNSYETFSKNRNGTRWC